MFKKGGLLDIADANNGVMLLMEILSLDDTSHHVGEPGVWHKPVTVFSGFSIPLCSDTLKPAGSLPLYGLHTFAKVTAAPY